MQRLARQFPHWYAYKAKAGDGTNCSQFADVSAPLIDVAGGLWEPPK